MERVIESAEALQEAASYQGRAVARRHRSMFDEMGGQNGAVRNDTGQDPEILELVLLSARRVPVMPVHSRPVGELRSRILEQGRDQHPQRVGRPHVIAVKEGNPLARGMGRPGAALNAGNMVDAIVAELREALRARIRS